MPQCLTGWIQQFRGVLQSPRGLSAMEPQLPRVLPQVLHKTLTSWSVSPSTSRGLVLPEGTS